MKDLVLGRPSVCDRGVGRERDGASQQWIEPARPLDERLHVLGRLHRALADPSARLGHGKEVDLVHVRTAHDDRGIGRSL